MAEKNIMISIDDEKAGKIAEILTNKTAKKILSYLADKEASEGDIVKELKLPPNTVNYNIKKLVDSGLIESSKTFFWSVKGKKIQQYKVSRKTIIISTKTSSAKIIGAFLLTGIAAVFVKMYSVSKNYVSMNPNAGVDEAVLKVAESGAPYAADSANAVVAGSVPSVINNAPIEVWPWFLFGGIMALIFYVILNWKKL